MFWLLATEVESVAQRKKNINESYDEVVRLAKVSLLSLNTFTSIEYFTDYILPINY